MSKDRGYKDAIVYELRATKNGIYKNVRTGDDVHLNIGNVWKQTTNPTGRYNQAELRRQGLMQVDIFQGNQIEILVMEKVKIYGYYYRNGSPPPGNRIFR